MPITPVNTRECAVWCLVTHHACAIFGGLLEKRALAVEMLVFLYRHWSSGSEPSLIGASPEPVDERPVLALRGKSAL